MGATIRSRFEDRLLPQSRRSRFYDHRRLPVTCRTSRSRLLQFYSSGNNVGNYLPVWAIEQMLDEPTDKWCLKDPAIDFDFINRNYAGVIVGGAGLIHHSFTSFWTEFFPRLRIPAILWGVGACLPDRAPHLDPKLFEEHRGRFDLVNLRDEVTAERYALDDAWITPCPSVKYLMPMRPRVTRERVLLAAHEKLAGARESRRLAEALGRICRFDRTSNQESFFASTLDILERDYLPARVVVTTRLHGAILAYALEIPYLAIAYDEKLRAFHRLYGGGICLEPDQAIDAAFDACQSLPPARDHVADIGAFGARARDWVGSL